MTLKLCLPFNALPYRVDVCQDVISGRGQTCRSVRITVLLTASAAHLYKMTMTRNPHDCSVLKSQAIVQRRKAEIYTRFLKSTALWSEFNDGRANE